MIGLAGNLFYSTNIPACLLIFRSSKPIERRGSLLFVDGSARFSKGRNQNSMDDIDVDAIVHAFSSGADPDGEGGVNVRLVDHAEIKENGWDLSISRYLSAAAGDTVDVETALQGLRDAQSALRVAEQHLDERLKAAGYA